MISSLPSSQQVIQQAKDKAAPKVGKLKELAQKYGAVGVLVYLGVGCVDLGLTFATIEMVGQQKVKQVEKSVLDIFKNAKAKMGLGEAVPTSTEESAPAADDDDEKASFASMFLLAYGIHKTVFLPVRLGITAAITPAVVRKLHALGWARYAPKLLGGAKKA
ncbi:uncharacterized protein BYT42DRAFT_593271 [Radiomyces spectabilis]|uniref:uncharacterized protein n=1 Tax=Radiomyces spectabilis TaxID=64574 RepID=UPI00221F4CC8|nr:uncharacterized protein BYT42DRAFT_593271 [Radiomyces spectabilis]KAI8381448.1 hypothetical protein BYT42DRAFT_593271 [Radiomyces spectabilis]